MTEKDPGKYRLRSKYSLPLYRWAKKHVAAGTRRITLDDTRKLLGLESVKDADGNIIQEEALPVWANFRQRALNTAIAEINKKTDLHIEIESLEKEGLRVHALVFSIVFQEIPDWLGEAVKAKVSTAPLPEFVEPMQAKLVASRPITCAWIYEIKFDGYRALALRGGNETRLLSRNQKDLGEKFPTIAESIAKLGVQDVVIDYAASGIINAMPHLVLRRTERGVPSSRCSPVRHKKVLLSECLKEAQ